MSALAGRFICNTKDISPNQARGFMLECAGHIYDIILWRHGEEVRAFHNQCPHLGMPLETFPDRFLTADKQALICSTHGARFDKTGFCFAGPCKGKQLNGINVIEKDGKVIAR